jgi:hypothetical protein
MEIRASNVNIVPNTLGVQSFSTSTDIMFMEKEVLYGESSLASLVEQTFANKT